MPTCVSCNSTSFTPDDVSGRLSCSTYDHLQDYDNYIDIYGGVSCPTGSCGRVEWSRGLCRSNGIDFRDLVSECLGRNGNADESATEVERFKRLSDDFLGMDKMKLSHECLAMVYSKSLDDMESFFKSCGGFGAVHEGEERQYFDPHHCTEWWNGKSELSKTLMHA
ncbi:hypothetical protein ACLB2K_064269 [Fragaria x ananassa]